jgi:hypothetical protein
MDASKMAALEGLVTEVDDENPAAQAEQQAEAQAQADSDRQAKEWGMLLWSFGQALAVWRPRLKAVYDEQACYRWGVAMAPVAEKRGWNGAATPEVTLLMVSLGFVMPTVQEVRAGLIELKSGESKADPAPVEVVAEAPSDGG